MLDYLSHPLLINNCFKRQQEYLLLKSVSNHLKLVERKGKNVSLVDFCPSRNFDCSKIQRH